MATGFTDKFQVAENPTFIHKVAMALCIEAVSKSTAPMFSALDDREKRFVKAITENAKGVATSVSMILSAEEDLEPDSSDPDIQTAVTSHWTTLSWMMDSI